MSEAVDRAGAKAKDAGGKAVVAGGAGVAAIAKKRGRPRKVGDERGGGGRHCNGYRMLEWVVESYEHQDVRECDAPSAAAWAILLAARRDEDTYRDVLKKYMDSKLKLDAAQGDTETRRFDGQAEYDILDGLEIGEVK